MHLLYRDKHIDDLRYYPTDKNKDLMFLRKIDLKFYF